MRGVQVCCVLSTLLVANTACTRHAVKEPLPTNATLVAHGIECHKERTTGSLVAATVCTSAADRARAADNTQNTKDEMQRVPAGPCMPTAPCH